VGIETSVLNLLSKELRGLQNRWIVLRFNAWQFERIGPPWWGLRVAAEAARHPIGRSQAPRGPDLRTRTEHTLKTFSHLLEPNPRSMKRLVNAYGIQRDLRLIEARGTGRGAVSAEHLALWTIVRMRWPLLADFLASSPGLVDGDNWPESEPALGALYASDDVTAVVGGQGIGIALTTDAVRALEGRSRWPLAA
jgi:hypothetical protein